MSLFSEFKPATAAEWKAQITKDLKGEPFENLVWKNENGFDIQPFYTSEDLHQPYAPAFTHADWEICVKGKSADAMALNKQLLRNLNSGATSISINCKGLDFVTALQGVQLNYIQATFYASVKEALALKLFLEQNYTLGELACCIFPEQLQTKADLESWQQVITAFRDFSNVKTVCVDALPVHNLNCVAYYEVAVILAGLNEYLGAHSGDGKRVSGLAVKTGVSSDYFIQMAKLRALRRLWKLLAGEYNISAGLHLLVETSATNKSISDNYNNLLRSTVEAMAAVSGGCNELIVTEFDLLFPVNEKLSERMAINQQLILKDESYFDKMADVACGAYYIESITDAIAARALETLKRFETEGGYFKCLEKNIFSGEIALQARQHEELVNNQKQVVIGVNKFRNEKENMTLNDRDIARLKQLPINNPVLKFELEHFFERHA